MIISIYPPSMSKASTTTTLLITAAIAVSNSSTSSTTASSSSSSSLSSPSSQSSPSTDEGISPTQTGLHTMSSADVSAAFAAIQNSTTTPTIFTIPVIPDSFNITATAGKLSTIQPASTNLLNASYVHCPPTFEELNLSETVFSGLYCNWTWDTFLCWPPATAGTVARMRCPAGHGIDETKFAERRCGVDGKWMGKPDGPYSATGWTNYTPCFSPETNSLLKKLYAGGSGDIVKMKFDIIERTRTLEIVGLIISLFALLLSLAIFCNFRSLRNNRTRIHKNLFVALVIQVLIRLTLYLDQAIIRRGSKIAGYGSTQGIENTPYLCEASYVFLENARTAMFMWMFIEGLYLHNVVTVTVFQGRFPHTIYACIGWGVPVIMTAIWAFFTSQYRGNVQCWWNYNLTPYYWILEGPRLAVILINFIFLLNIIRVLIVKLRQSHTSDIEQARKAVRAAVVLLPLLGITNVLHMTEAPLEKSVWVFALWSYTTHFLRSFQGLFIATIYCFLNGEVRAALLKSLSVYMSLRGHSNWVPRRASMFSAAYNTAPETEGQCNDSANRQESSPRRQGSKRINNNNRQSRRWMMSLCFRGQKNKCVMSNDSPPAAVVMTTKIA